MPTITLSEEYDAKLKMLVTEPFEDTRESLIESLIDEAYQLKSDPDPEREITPADDSTEVRLNPDSHESLKHTRVLSAMVDGSSLNRPKWNSILKVLHVKARTSLGTFDAVNRVSPANLREGEYLQEGFKFLPEANLSMQGVSANQAWDHSLVLARALNVPISVSFEWRNKEEAAHPGQSGILAWQP